MFDGCLDAIPFVGPSKTFQWIDTDHDWPGDRMDEERCVWENNETECLIDTSCGAGHWESWANVVAETYKFCPNCGKQIEVNDEN